MKGQHQELSSVQRTSMASRLVGRQVNRQGSHPSGIYKFRQTKCLIENAEAFRRMHRCWSIVKYLLYVEAKGQVYLGPWESKKESCECELVRLVNQQMLCSATCESQLPAVRWVCTIGGDNLSAPYLTTEWANTSFCPDKSRQPS